MILEGEIKDAKMSSLFKAFISCMAHFSENCFCQRVNQRSSRFGRVAGRLLFNPRLYAYWFDMNQEVHLDYEHSYLSKLFLLVVLKFSKLIYLFYS